MTQAPAAVFEIPTESSQPARGRAGRARKAAAKPRAVGLAAGRVTGVETRSATRGGRDVIELEHGITVHPPRDKGGRVHRMLSALVGADIEGGYLGNPMLTEVNWQAGDRLLPAPKVTVAGAGAAGRSRRDPVQ